MHPSTPIPLQRPDSPQSLLRLFAAGTSPRLPERVRYLWRPSYRMRDARPVTFAGDGRVFIWCAGRVPGFRDYEVPPFADQYVDVASVLNAWRPGHGLPLPGPDGSWRGNAKDDWTFAGCPARVARYDLARLALMDSVYAWGLNKYPSPDAQGRYSPGWKTLGLSWSFGTLHGHGVVLCHEPAVRRISRTRRRAAERKNRAA